MNLLKIDLEIVKILVPEKIETVILINLFIRFLYENISIPTSKNELCISWTCGLESLSII